MTIADIAALYVEHIRVLETRYARALTEAGFDAVMVHSGTPKKRTEFDDQSFPLRPTPELQRWAPLFEADAFVVVHPGRPTQLLWPECTSFWERPAPPPSMHFADVLDVKRNESPQSAIATLAALGAHRVAWYGEDTSKAASLGFAPEACNPPSLLRALDEQRILKTAYEVACLAEANRLAALGHAAVRDAFAHGTHSELELHLTFLRATRQDDQDTPYKNIVALGENGAVLHHISYGRHASVAESLLVDAGACWLGYCSDITRTWVRPRGAFDSATTSLFSHLVTAMDAMQQRLVSLARVGLPYEHLHNESHRLLSALLVESGVATGSADEIDARGISRVFCPHGLGHSLGLVTHDVGCARVRPAANNPFLRNTSVIAPDQVFTIEPGIYFIEGLLAPLRASSDAGLVNWKVVDALRPFGGIRIEDDLHVLDNGVRNLTREVLPVGGSTL